jgi:hypothetical protein
MDTAAIRVSTKQVREFSTFYLSNALRHYPLVACAIVANGMQTS